MTGGRQRRRRQRRNARQGSTPTATHISSLGEDVVLEIFLRLASLATLVRAALTCRAWRRAVASSPDFRRRFRALHPAPPLLGIFFDSVSTNALYRPPCGPSFVPGAFRDWDLAGAVGSGDFLLTSLLKRSTGNSYPYWKILDCCGGRVLLTDISDINGDISDDGNNPLIVLNPLMPRNAHEFRYPDPGPKQYQTTPRLICLDKDPPSSFRVVLLAFGGCTLRASIFPSDTNEWSDLPGVDIPARLAADGTSSETIWIEDEWKSSEIIWIEDEWKLRANGFLYWRYRWCAEAGRYVDGIRYLISLDTATLEFSFAELPPCLWINNNGVNFTFHAGEAEDGAACIVYADGSNIGVVKHTRGDDGVDRWVPDRVLRFVFVQHLRGDNAFDYRWVPNDRVFRVELDAELKPANWPRERLCNDLSVLAVRDGYVYFATSKMRHDTRRTCWIMSLCLATMKVEKLFQRSYDGDAFAYIMPWPPCLLTSNYGQFALDPSEKNSEIKMPRYCQPISFKGCID